MGQIKGLLVGVSSYNSTSIVDLPFCKNDISLMQNALVNGLNAISEDIIICGYDGTVSEDEFVKALTLLSILCSEDDTVFFYFSGHGGIVNNQHVLMLSDTPVGTDKIIHFLEKAISKNKIICLDACQSGKFEIDQSAIFDINDTVERFAGRGYAVFASSGALQSSYGHPEKPISLFTAFLSDAISDRHFVRQGKRSLYDIKKLLFLYMDIWNKKNPKRQQTPIYRANLGGTIYFCIEEYHPFNTLKMYENCQNYIIHSVEPLHSSNAKRYSVKVILKSAFSFDEIASINHKIVEKVKELEIYSNDLQQKRWRGVSANRIFCYFGFDEEDMINSNFVCHTTWVDDSQNKEWWYKANGSDSFIVNNTHISVHSYYDSLKAFINDHTADKETTVKDTRLIMATLIMLAEKVIAIYNEYINNTVSENELIIDLQPLLPQINEFYFKETELPTSPIDIDEWSQKCSALAGTIHDMTLYYPGIFLSDRTPENRKACMNMTIERYYQDVEALRVLDNQVQYPPSAGVD